MANRVGGDYRGSFFASSVVHGRAFCVLRRGLETDNKSGTSCLHEPRREIQSIFWRVTASSDVSKPGVALSRTHCADLGASMVGNLTKRRIACVE